MKYGLGQQHPTYRKAMAKVKKIIMQYTEF
jgi:hypothetical protein